MENIEKTVITKWATSLSAMNVKNVTSVYVTQKDFDFFLNIITSIQSKIHDVENMFDGLHEECKGVENKLLKKVFKNQKKTLKIERSQIQQYRKFKTREIYKENKYLALNEIEHKNLTDEPLCTESEIEPTSIKNIHLLKKWKNEKLDMLKDSNSALFFENEIDNLEEERIKIQSLKSKQRDIEEKQKKKVQKSKELEELLNKYTEQALEFSSKQKQDITIFPDEYKDKTWFRIQLTWEIQNFIIQHNCDTRYLKYSFEDFPHLNKEKKIGIFTLLSEICSFIGSNANMAVLHQVKHLFGNDKLIRVEKHNFMLTMQKTFLPILELTVEDFKNPTDKIIRLLNSFQASIKTTKASKRYTVSNIIKFALKIERVLYHKKVYNTSTQREYIYDD